MDEFGFEYLSIIKECMDKVYGENLILLIRTAEDPHMNKV